MPILVGPTILPALDSRLRDTSRLLLRILTTLTLTLLVAACSGGSPSGPDLSGDAMTMRLIPHGAEINMGDELQFDAVLQDSRGLRLQGEEITWIATGGTISSSGMFVAGENPGSYSVIAQTQQGGSAIAASASVQISSSSPADDGSDGEPTSSTDSDGGGRIVSVSPKVVTLFTGDALQFNGSVKNKRGKVLNVGLAWSATGGSISSSGFYVAGGQTGDFTVTARAGSDLGTATVQILSSGEGAPRGDGGGDPDPPNDPDPPSDPDPPADPTPTSISVQPEQADLLTGDELQFTATVKDENGQPMDEPISWQATGGTIDDTGHYVAGNEPSRSAVHPHHRRRLHHQAEWRYSRVRASRQRSTPTWRARRTS